VQNELGFCRWLHLRISRNNYNRYRKVVLVMKICVEVPIENIYNALDAPHSRYWAKAYRWEEGMDLGHVYDRIDEKGYELHSENLRSGLELMAKNSPMQFARLVAGDQDGPVGDTLLQYMAFGELKYVW
jgi:hypothetical protein